jgi:hypothetical protein
VRKNALLLVILLGIVHDIEESQLIDTLRCRYNTKPIAKLLLLQELLCPNPMSLASYPKSHVWDATYKYFK